jgi:hypothetical protein
MHDYIKLQLSGYQWRAFVDAFCKKTVHRKYYTVYTMVLKYAEGVSV